MKQVHCVNRHIHQVIFKYELHIYVTTFIILEIEKNKTLFTSDKRALGNVKPYSIKAKSHQVIIEPHYLVFEYYSKQQWRSIEFLCYMHMSTCK